MRRILFAFALAALVFAASAPPAAAQQCYGINVQFADDRVRVSGCERRLMDAQAARELGIDNLGTGGFAGRLRLPGYEGARWSHAALWRNGTREHGGDPWGNMGRGARPYVEVRPVSARILDVTQTPAIVGRRTCRGLPGFTCSTTFSEEVTETRSHSWSSSSTVSTGFEVSYGGSVGIDVGIKAGAQSQYTVSFGFEHAWGEERMVETSKTLGTADTVGVVVGRDGRPVSYGLATQRGEMEIEVVYETRVGGDIYAKWDTTWRGRHHHLLPLERVMREAGLATRRRVDERITYGFYSTGTLWEEGPHAELVRRVRAWRAEQPESSAHARRWRRVLVALGAERGGDPMTADEAAGYAALGWGRWDGVVVALRRLER